MDDQRVTLHDGQPKRDEEEHWTAQGIGDGDRLDEGHDESGRRKLGGKCCNRSHAHDLRFLVIGRIKVYD